MRFSGFVGPAYETRSRYQDAQRSINWYPEIDPTPGAASVMALYPTPGLYPYLDATETASARPVRLLYTPPTREDLLIACIGNKVVCALPAGVNFTLTTHELASNVGPMTVADNGTDLLLSDGANGYSLNIQSLAFARLTDPAFFAGRPIFLDGYFVLNKPGTAQFYWSGLYALTWDGLDFATKEAWPDDIVTVWSEHRQLWLLGAQTTEIWYNTGNADGAFERNQGAFMQHGCAAPYSVSRLGETFAFVATDERGSAMVVMAEGQSLRKISTQALDYTLSQYETVSDAIAFTYRDAGHEFYQLTFPTANQTWVFDISTQLWHQRASLDQLGELNRHRANCSCNYRGQVLVGDYENGLIYAYRSDVYSDNGAAIPRIRRCPHIVADRKNVRYDELQIVFEPAPTPGFTWTVAGSWEEEGIDALYTFEEGYQDSVTGEEATVVGGGVSRVTSPAKFGDYSARFTTYNSYLRQETTLNGGNLPVPTDTQEFYMNGWFWVDTSTTGAEQYLLGYGVAMTFRFDPLWGLSLRYRDSTNPMADKFLKLEDTANVTPDAWHHVEVDRAGNTLYVFLDGILKATVGVTNNVVAFSTWGGTFVMGPTVDGGSFTQPFQLDHIQVGIGHYLHTADFPLPTVPPTPEPITISGFPNGDPQAMLRWSDDGGSTWSSEHWRSIGKTGRYKHRARWLRMGSARDRVYEVRVTDPVKAVIIDAQLDLNPGYA